MILFLFLTWDSLRRCLLPRTISPTGHFTARIIISYISGVFLPGISSSLLDEDPLKIRSHLLPLRRKVPHIRSPRSFLTLWTQN